MTTKYKNILFSGLLASVILVTASCTDQEPATGAATISASSPNVTINADDFQNVPGVEADGTYTYTITLSEPQIADVKFEVYQSGGTATAHEDYDLGESSIIIPAYETSATGSITFYADTDPEETETLQITVGDETTANVNFTPQEYDFVLDNFESEFLDCSFAFCEEVTFSGTQYIWSDLGGDADVYLSEAEGFDINDPWNSNVVEEVFTTDCPEIMTLEAAELGDGTYIFWHEIWENLNSSFWEPQLIPITATFTQAGVFKKTVIQDESQAIDVTLPGFADDDYEGTVIHGAIAMLTIAGDAYIISDYEGNEIASGKMVDGKMKTARSSSFTKAAYSGLRFEK